MNYRRCVLCFSAQNYNSILQNQSLTEISLWGQYWSISDNGVKEERSVLFIIQLLLGKAKSRIETDDKIANIDGYFDLLDSTKRICGKITVQVKTISPAHESLNKYPYPASLFADAVIAYTW